MNPCSTQHQFFNGSKYPCFYINWDKSELGNGMQGTLTLYHGPNDKDERTHQVSLVQSNPLGSIHVDFDLHEGGGSWDYASFEGASITERDLQWATLWAALSLRARRSVKMGDLREIKQPK